MTRLTQQERFVYRKQLRKMRKRYKYRKHHKEALSALPNKLKENVKLFCKNEEGEYVPLRRIEL